MLHPHIRKVQICLPKKILRKAGLTKPHLTGKRRLPKTRIVRKNRLSEIAVPPKSDAPEIGPQSEGGPFKVNVPAKLGTRENAATIKLGVEKICVLPEL